MSHELIVGLVTLAIAAIGTFFGWRQHERSKARLRLTPGSMQLHANPLRFPSVTIANVGEVATTLAEAGCIVRRKERVLMKGLKVNGTAGHPWNYRLQPGTHVNAYMYQTAIETLRGRELRAIYVKTTGGGQFKEKRGLAELQNAVDIALAQGPEA